MLQLPTEIEESVLEPIISLGKLEKGVLAYIIGYLLKMKTKLPKGCEIC